MNESNEEERLTHPSYGQISFSRVTCNPAQPFYGSELPQDHYITMKVHNSEINRTLTKDWHFAKSIPLIQIRMSSNQFAEMLTSLNVGSGVPCTIEMINKVPVEEYPAYESRKEFVHRKFEDRMKEFAETLKEKQLRVKELTAKKTLSKENQRELNFLVEWLTQEVASNIPFFAKCFQETMDVVVNEAKSEIENAIQHKVTMLGLEELHKQNALLNNKTT
jgi:hypothetical protein